MRTQVHDTLGLNLSMGRVCAAWPGGPLHLLPQLSMILTCNRHSGAHCLIQGVLTREVRCRTLAGPA